MNVYKVKYYSAWEDSEYLEADETNVAAEDAEAAIEKTRRTVLDTVHELEDDDGNAYTAKRKSFKLISVNFITEFEE